MMRRSSITRFLPVSGLALVCLVAGIALAARGDAPRAAAGSGGGFTTEITVAGIPNPVDFVFAPDGRIFVASLRGQVRVIKDGALLSTPFLVLTANGHGERGLIGLALDPNFAANGYVYVYYTYENNPADPQGPKTGRLIRVTADGDVAQAGSEVILLGSVVGDASSPSCEDFPSGTDCIPADGLSHVGGSLWFGPDGMLYLATGDGAYFPGILSPLAQRSQDLDSLAGKIVRVDPDDGSAVSDNPFYNGDAAANRSKVWAYGLRQPFRTGIQPGTGVPFVGDVGSRFWEEINIAEAGLNYGWPCYEGTAQNPDAAGFPVCQTLYASGAPTQHPLYAYAHESGAAVVGGAFYEGASYPDDYQGALFFGDWERRTVSLLELDDDNKLLPDSVQTVFQDEGGPVDFEMGPDGDMYYLTWAASFTGEVRRIGFVAGNRAPVAKASASPAGGLAPLTVQFSSDGSMDPDGQPVTYFWDFRDGTTSTEPNPTHTFGANATYNVRLVVRDSDGAIGSANAPVLVGNRPPLAVVSLPLPYSTYTSGAGVTYSGFGLDAEQGTLSNASLRWSITLHHCFPSPPSCHAHPFLEVSNASTGSFAAPTQGDEIFYMELRLTATDSVGLTGEAAVLIGPDSDGDGALDFEELLYLGTDRLDPDTDGNGISDGAEDSDGDRCRDVAELRPDPTRGGDRDPANPWDYFNPTLDGVNRLDDVLIVVQQYYEDAFLPSPPNPPDTPNPSYNPGTDRTALGPDPWDLGPPDGLQRVDDILAIVAQYYHDCS